VCVHEPGFEPDLYVTADIGAFARMWLGEITFAAARGKGTIKLTGRRELVKAFPECLMRSPYAEVPRPAID
jgi:hypothetical protein